MRIKPLVVSLVLFTLAMPQASWAAAGQRHPFPPPQDKTLPSDEERADIAKDMAKKANQERQEQLKRDTDRLLKLATELKLYVDKTNENMLSLEVLKKSEEIEKLAHSVKEKMKGN